MSVHDFRGSGHITAMAHCAGPDGGPDGRQFSLNGKRRLDMLKTNLGVHPEGIGIEDAERRGVGALPVRRAAQF